MVANTNNRLFAAFFLPILGAGLVAFLAGSSPLQAMESPTSVVLLLGPLGIISWLLGLRWYGLPGMGLRGGRPLFAGIGFAVLGWIVVIIARVYFVHISELATGLREFVFLLLFEAFAVQLWAFGLLFRGLSDWRGGLTAAIGSGIIFGAIASQLFQEAFVEEGSSFLYFATWGILYGIIRLRTGSILGPVVVQSAQSFSTWVALQPVFPINDVTQLRNFYLISTVAFVVLIWRLWPRREDDYRV